MERIDSLEEIGGAIKLLRRGGVIVYPTETVYGLGCLTSWFSSIDRIAELKRSMEKASFLILIGGRQALDQFCTDIPDPAERLINFFWPGPLTLILPAAANLHPRLVGPSLGVAVRQSSHPWPQAILTRLNDGLVSTSANPSRAAAPISLDQIDSRLLRNVDMTINGGCLNGGISTLLDLCEAPPLLRREGAIPRIEIERLIGQVRVH